MSDITQAAARLVLQEYDQHDGEILNGPNGEQWSRSIDGHHVGKAYLKLVNSHASLLAACQAAEQFLEEGGDPTEAYKIQSKLRAAIQQAGGDHA